MGLSRAWLNIGTRRWTYTSNLDIASIIGNKLDLNGIQKCADWLELAVMHEKTDLSISSNQRCAVSGRALWLQWQIKTKPLDPHYSLNS
jgi:hypothetical protein